MSHTYPLCDLPEGRSAQVKRVNASPGMRRRLGDLGLIEGTIVKCLQKSPWGDPAAYLIRGAAIALRSEDSSGILMM